MEYVYAAQYASVNYPKIEIKIFESKFIKVFLKFQKDFSAFLITIL